MTHTSMTVPENSPPWYREYQALCAQGTVAIYEKQLTAPALATLVLEAFRGNLSASAVARWSAIAKETP